MDLRSLPPPPFSVLLKHGGAYWAENFAEAMIFTESGDFKLAKSVVGPLKISTVFLTCHIPAHHDLEREQPGTPAPGASFETMVEVMRPAEFPLALNDLYPKFERHVSIDEAILFHMRIRTALEAELKQTAQWECKPFRVPAHGNPSEAAQAALRGELT